VLCLFEQLDEAVDLALADQPLCLWVVLQDRADHLKKRKGKEGRGKQAENTKE
jgi:hypothetical protein